MKWISRKGDRYVITGVGVNGKRFRVETSNWYHANGHNVWRGNIWLLRDGKRTRIKSYYNF
jgi:hypothetical protein